VKARERGGKWEGGKGSRGVRKPDNQKARGERESKKAGQPESQKVGEEESEGAGERGGEEGRLLGTQ
jgi:hypothetical protein